MYRNHCFIKLELSCLLLIFFTFTCGLQFAFALGNVNLKEGQPDTSYLKVEQKLDSLKAQTAKIETEIRQIPILMNDSFKSYLSATEEKIITNIKQKSNWKDYMMPIIPLLVALIAGSIALYQVKLNVITSARITWIESLRSATSEYISEVEYVHELIDDTLAAIQQGANQEKTIEKEYHTIADGTKKINQLAQQIKLALNPSEEKHKALQEKLIYVGKMSTTKFSREDLQKRKELSTECVDLCQVILKEEWDKAKNTAITRIWKKFTK